MKISRHIIEAIYSQGEREAPLEACGYLAGTTEAIREIFPMVNIDKSPDHFSLDPGEQFAVIRQARQKGLEVLAVYHTHPASPARPSLEDIKLAYDPKIVYIIAALGGEKEINAFKIINGEVNKINMEII